MDATNKDKLVELTGQIEHISELKKYNRISPARAGYDYHKLSFIENYDELVNFAPDLQNGILKIAISCLRDLYAPYSAISEDTKLLDIIQNALDNHFESCSADMQILILQDTLWKGNFELLSSLIENSKTIDSNVRAYFQAIASLFQLDFSRLEESCEYWEPKEEWATIKAGLLSHLDVAGAKKILKSNTYSLAQEELYNLELQVFLAAFSEVDKTMSAKQGKLSHEGLIELEAILDTLLADVSAKESKIEARGAGKFVTNEGISVSRQSAILSSLQIIGVLTESGFPPSVANSSIRSHTKFFPAILNCINFYPIPTLFYSLLFNEKGFLKRIGQEFAYKKNVDAFHDQILSSFKFALGSLKTPDKFRRNIVLMLSEFIVAIDPALWEPLVMEIWIEAVQQKSAFVDNRSDTNEIFFKAMPLITNPSAMAKVVGDCINATGPDNRSLAIKYLYFLAQNPRFKKHRKLIRDDVGDTLIQSLTDSIQENFDDIFLIGNIGALFTPEDTEKVKVCLSKLPFKEIKNERVWGVIYYFIRTDRDALKSFSKGLIASKKLWNSGISTDKKSVSGGTYFIELRNLRRRGAGSSPFSSRQVKFIFEKLIVELDKIEELTERAQFDNFMNFRSILQEMKWFLEDESRILSSIEKYGDTLKKVSYLFLKNKNGVQPIDALFSNNSVDISWAVSDISRDLYDCEKFSHHQSEIFQILSRLAAKSLVGLETLLGYVSSWFYDFRDNAEMRQFSHLTVAVLNQYKAGYPEGSELPYVEEKLTKIAVIFLNWGIENESVRHFAGMLYNSRYNNVRYNLLETLRQDGVLNEN